jgi:hypothetical protein
VGPSPVVSRQERTAPARGILGRTPAATFRLAYERLLAEGAVRLDEDLLLDAEAFDFAAGRLAAPDFDGEAVAVRAADFFEPVLEVRDADLALVEEVFDEAGFAVAFLAVDFEAPLFFVAVFEAPLFFADVFPAPDDLVEALEDFFCDDRLGGANSPLTAPTTAPAAVPIVSLATVSALLSFRLAMCSP